MLVKDLYQKYPNYDIVLFGKPLNKVTIPFTFLPYDRKELMNMEVVDIQIKEKAFDAFRISFSNLEHKGTEHYKGTIIAYCEKEK